MSCLVGEEQLQRAKIVLGLVLKRCHALQDVMELGKEFGIGFSYGAQMEILVLQPIIRENL